MISVLLTLFATNPPNVVSAPLLAKKVLWFFSALIPALAMCAEHPQLKAFPPAEPGMKRAVIVLDPMDNEQDYMVGIIVGQERMTDGVNHQQMGGAIKAEPLKGWGYTYYVAKSAPVMSTMMAPPPGQPEVKKFVTMREKRVRYNSKLPVVVYTSRDLEVRYRIWRAGETKAAE